jgi:protein-disulfide isomerase
MEEGNGPMTEGYKRSPRVYGAFALILLVAGAAIAWAVLDLRSRAPDDKGASVTRMPADEFEMRVRDYLISNPEVIVESLQLLETRKRATAESQIKAALAAREEEILRDPDSPVGGNPGGDVTLVEFADYNCPYCRRVAPTLAEAEASDPELRVVYKEIPILGPDSVFAAKAALAARRQGKYVDFHRALMNVKGVAAEGLVFAIAAKVGLDVERLKADMEASSIQAAIDRNLALARALGINGTPSFVVGDKVVSGAIDLRAMQQLIGRARERN